MPESGPRQIGRRRGGLTIQIKLSGLILALVGSVVALFTITSTARKLRDLEANLQRKANLYVALGAQQLKSAVAFGDAESAGKVFEALAVDADVVATGLYTASGRAVKVRGDLPPRLPPEDLGAGFVGVRSQVVSSEGPKGTLVLRLSTAALVREQSAAMRASVVMGLGALVICLFGAWLISRSFARRVRAVSDAASAVAGGNFAVSPVHDDASDEIGTLARGFNSMVGRLRALVTNISDSAHDEASRLEQLVSALDRRNAEMRLVLDNVEQGFVTLDGLARVSVERSRVLDDWFGSAGPDAAFATWAFEDPDQRTLFQLAWEALLEGMLPQELLLAQLPSRLSRAGRLIDISYRPLVAPGDTSAEAPLDRVLVIMTDITATLARARAEEQQRELAAVVERFGQDRASVVEFFGEGRRLVEGIANVSRPAAERARDLHTLKGSAALIGLTALAALCHEIEDLAAEALALRDPDVARLRVRFSEDQLRFSFLLRAANRVEIEATEVDVLSRAVQAGASAGDILDALADWSREPVGHRLEQLAEQARQLAERLGKLPLDVVVQGSELRVPRGALSHFWATLTHVVRNAVDHGIERPDERAARGKPPRARLVLRARIGGNRFVVEVEDGGRGIDWERIRQRARRMGLAADTAEQLVAALCADGLSTQDTTTFLSGRGVGMAATAAACRASGGTLEIESQRGRGTVVRFLWPLDRVGLGPREHADIGAA